MDRLPLSRRMIGRDEGRYILEAYPQGRDGPLTMLVYIDQDAYEQECGSAAKGISPRIAGDDMMARIERAGMAKLLANDVAPGGYVEIGISDLD
jgi:hypothetical protein